jgi:SAM-dependent methyltransferase
MGSTIFHNQEFKYVECQACGSLFCQTMPDRDVLAAMYGKSYLDTWYVSSTETDSREEVSDSARVSAWLHKLPTGLFVDYGCGRGELLGMAKSLGWKAVGIEFDPEVARSINRATGARVVTQLADLGTAPSVDVLHLGDVLEHMTDINKQMPEILRWIRPGGVLLAQGPLENNATLFLQTLRLSHKVRVRGPARIPPYHVSLATLRGQRALFGRFGLREAEFRVSEVSWPAPHRLTPDDIKRPRQLALFTLRKFSQMVSLLHASRWGNRYFFAGRLPMAPG